MLPKNNRKFKKMDRMTDKRSKAESRKQRVFEKLVNHMRRKGEWVPNDYPCDE